MIAAVTHRPLARLRSTGMALALCAVFGFGACSCLSGPAGFWKAYHPGCVVESSSDQGPWGGTRTLRWAACGSVRYSPDDVRAFAKRHGWKLLDEVDGETAAREVGSGDTYPRFMKVPSIVLRFDTGWMREEPGSGEMSTAVGYVQVARDGSSMYLFQFWGNG